MKLYRGLDATPRTEASVVTIGKYDGVHRGHQALLAELRQAGEAAGLPAAVVTFDPAPEAFFAPDRAPARLTPIAEKLEALRDAGVDIVWLLPFNARLAAVEAGDFVRRVLVAGLGAREVWIGDDFRFGHKRRGDLALLKRLGPAEGFTAHAMPSFRLDGERVSSGAVRAALARGEMTRARRMLGRPYALCGRVIYGEQLGSRLGFATANIAVRHQTAIDGVFAVRVDGVDGGRRPGVASLGTRPTVGGDRQLLEVHLFDYSGNLYGRRIRVTFVDKLRDEHRFESLAALVDQMAADADAARAVLADETGG